MPRRKRNDMNDLLDLKGFHAVLVERLGEHAPAKSTLQSWMKPAVQARDPFMRDHMPRPLRIRGQIRHLYRRRDCEGLAEAILSNASAARVA